MVDSSLLITSDREWTLHAKHVLHALSTVRLLCHDDDVTIRTFARHFGIDNAVRWAYAISTQQLPD
jgi:hypothetical protein